MPRRALLVGLDEYKNAAIPTLRGCVADARSLHELLQADEDESPNYDCEILTSDDARPVTRGALRTWWEKLLQFDGEVLFYFAGHGSDKQGGCLVTQDGQPGDLGLPMDELLRLALQSEAREILIILDCCHAGELGNPDNLNLGNALNVAQLREGMTILAAARPDEKAAEGAGGGLFTKLLAQALRGGAADVRGDVFPARAYAYADAVLNAWQQRPVFKTYSNRSTPIRRCRPSVSDETLRRLPRLFAAADQIIKVGPAYEHTRAEKHPDRVADFNDFKTLRNASLLRVVDGRDLYYACVDEPYGDVALTSLGRFYWQLAKARRI